jgi:hypothetical protein
MAWYAGAGALVAAMVGALGWLAWENANKVPELTVETTLVLPTGETSAGAAHGVPAAPVAALVHAEPALHADAAAAPVHPPQPVPAVTATAPVGEEHPVAAMIAAAAIQDDRPVPQTAGAAIIDNPAPAAEAPVVLAQAAPGAKAAPESVKPSGLPPLVLLPPEEAGPKRTPTAAVHASALPKAVASVQRHLDTAPASRPAAKAEAHASRTAARTNRTPTSRLAAKADPAPTRVSVKAQAHRAAKPVLARAKKTQVLATAESPAKAHDAAADGDVALISAIIMHSSRHAAERAKAGAAKACDGGKCPVKTAARK